MDLNLAKTAIVKIISGKSIGTGFLVSKEGHLITCDHVLASRSIQCWMSDKEGAYSIDGGQPSILFFRDEKSGDFALLQIKTPLPAHIRPLNLYSPGQSVGNDIFSFGFPNGGEINGMAGKAQVVDVGILSQDNYPLLQLGNANDFTNGFSGAPIIDLKLGGVIGILSEITQPDRTLRKMGIAFGVPIDFIEKTTGKEFPVKVKIPGIIEWPIGIRPIAKKAPTRKSNKEIRYSDYLYSDRLPYLSRDDFKINSLDQESDFQTETEILDQLLGTKAKASYYEACIISGEGGVGKTRLMRQLGLMALDRGWEVLIVDRQIQSLEIVKELLEEGKKYLFVFDYLEENIAFEAGITDVLTPNESDIEIKLLANCRNTFKNNSSGRYPTETRIAEVELELTNPLEIQYKEYVVKSLLAEIPGIELPISQKLSELAEVRPAFAVFARFLIDSEKDKKEHLELGTFKDFSGWLKRRLALSLNIRSDEAIPDEVFHLFFIFPISESTKEKIRKTYSNWYNRLIDDGWFEQEESERFAIRVIHDTIADTLLHIFLVSRKKQLQDTLKDSLRFAIHLDQLDSWIRSIERIQHFDILNSFSAFPSLFQICLPNTISGNQDSCYMLARSSLVAEDDRLELFASKPVYFESFLQSKYFSLPLAYLTNLAAKDRQQFEVHLSTIQTLHHQLHAHNPDWSSWYNQGSRLISTYIRLFGLTAYIKPVALEFIAAFSRGRMMSFVFARWLEEAGEVTEIQVWLDSYLKVHAQSTEAAFVYRSWLEAGGETQIIRARIESYLEGHAQSPEAGFVYRSWLDAGGETAPIQAAIKSYLKVHAQFPRAQFVYKSWLDAGGETAVVQAAIESYLEVHAQSSEAPFVYKSWLDAGGEKAVVQAAIESYLEVHAQSPEAPFVYKSWLNAGGKTTVIQAAIESYLEIYSQSVEAPFVYQSWLDAGGKTTVIKAAIKRYLQVHSQSAGAQFVYKSWLDAGGEIAMVQPAIMSYLENHAQSIEARFVYKAWLDAGGEIALVQPAIKSYLEVFAQSAGAKFVYKSWLDAGGEIAVIQSAVERYLEVHAQSPGAQFVYKSWLDAGGLPEVIESAIESYLEVHAQSTEAPFVYQSWLDAGGGTKVIEAAINSYLEVHAQSIEAPFVYKSWLNAGGETALIQAAIKSYLEVHAQSPEAQFVYKSWLDAGGGTEVIQAAIEKYLKVSAQSSEAQFVYKSWLDAGGEITAIQAAVKKYLEVHAQSVEAQFVYNSWLDAGERQQRYRLRWSAI